MAQYVNKVLKFVDAYLFHHHMINNTQQKLLVNDDIKNRKNFMNAHHST